MRLDQRTVPSLSPDLFGVFDRAPFGAALIDREGVVVWANSTLVALMGEADDTIVLHSLLDVRMGEGEGAVWREMLSSHFATPCSARQPRTGRFEFGSSMGVIQTMEITLMPAAPAGFREDTEDDIVLAYFNSLARQITAERRFNQIFESLPLGLLITDANQRIVKVNSRLAKDFGYTTEALVGQPLSQLIPQRLRTAHDGHMATYTAAPETRLMGADRDVTGLHRSGEEFPVEIALSRLDNMRLPLFLALVADISARKRAEVALQQTNIQLEEFTYIASHDLRSPLRGIADLISWIREDLGEDTLPETAKHNFDRIALRIARSEQMIDDLLAYARAGNRVSDLDTIDPAAIVEDAVSMVVTPDTFRIETDISATPFLGPRTPIATCLRNLVSNAVKHHGQSTGLIRVSVHDEGRFTVFTVDDDGSGIPQGAESRIFKLFHRASPTTPGDGVGLAFTRRMVSAHGGTISATAHGPLGGASFVIHWPRILLREGAHG